MFQFKQFSISDNHSAMKVGTDGILLGAWANFDSNNTILDIGTGTGLIACIAAQKNDSAKVIGIDIDENAILDAKINQSVNPWKNRLQFNAISLQQFKPSCQFDHIISNPPFFENAMKSITAGRNTARHTDSLHYNHILNFGLKHLTHPGRISIILPTENALNCIKQAKEFGFFNTRICYVKPTPTKDPHRILFELSQMECAITESSLTIETGKRHEYTEEYKKLGQPFYLYF